MTTANIIDVYGAFTTIDEYGRIGECLGWFSIERDAKLAAAKRGWYNGDGTVKKAKAISITNSDGRFPQTTVYVLADPPNPIDLDGTRTKVRAQIKATALKKLTAEEIDALGL